MRRETIWGYCYECDKEVTCRENSDCDECVMILCEECGDEHLCPEPDEEDR
jgi:RNase P subunit RPR2